MLTRKALNGVPHPLFDTCRGPHNWNLDHEEGVLYLYCTECEETHKLDKEKVIVRYPYNHK